MLKSFTIKNFKSFKDATLELSPFTLMIGANASGKSNALEALQFISWIMSHNGDTLGFFSRDEFRGTRSSIFNDDRKAISFRIETKSENDNNVEFGIIINEKTVNDVEFTIDNNEKVQGKEYFKVLSSFESVYKNLNSDNLKNFKELDKVRAKLSNEFNKSIAYEFLKKIFFIDVIPSFMREYSFIGDENLGGNAENTSSILQALCKEIQTKKRIIDFITTLPEQNIINIDFITTERDEVMLKLEESFGNKKRFHDASVLSDGTLRALAIATFLFSAEENSILIVEEVDNGIHPSRIKDFMQKIRDIATERKLQVIMTSHNPALLDTIPNGSLEDVVCCYRDKDEGDSRFVRLGELYHYPELVAGGSLGSMVTRGFLEKYVHDKRTPEEHIKDNLAWFEAFDAKHKKCNENASDRG